MAEFLPIGGTDGERARAFRTTSDGKQLSVVEGLTTSTDFLDESLVIEPGGEEKFFYEVNNNSLSLGLRTEDSSSLNIYYRTRAKDNTYTSPDELVYEFRGVWDVFDIRPKAKNIRILIKNTSDRPVKVRQISISDFMDFKEKEEVPRKRREKFIIAEKAYRDYVSADYLVFANNFEVPGYAYGAVITASFTNLDAESAGDFYMRVGINDPGGTTVTTGPAFRISDTGLIHYYICPEASLFEDYPPLENYDNRVFGYFPIRLLDKINIRVGIHDLVLGDGKGVECEVHGYWLI